MLSTEYYWVQRLIPSKKNQSVLIAKISSRKTQKITTFLRQRKWRKISHVLRTKTSRKRLDNNDLNQVLASSGFRKTQGFGRGAQSHAVIRPGLGRS